MKLRSIAVLIVLALLVVGSVGATAQEAWKLIDWNKPVPMVERLTSDQYILPEGWEEATKGVEKLVFYNSGGLAGDIATAINLELFEQKTGIQVEAIGVSIESFNKVFSALVSKDGAVPVLLANEPWMEMSALANDRWLVPLDFLYPPEVQELYRPEIQKMLYRDGHWWGSLLVAFDEGVIYYRPSWLKGAGVEVPTTYQELYEAAKKAQSWAQQNVDPSAYGLVYGASLNRFPTVLQQLIYSQGGQFYNEEEGKYQLLSPEVKNAFEYLVTAVREGVTTEEVQNYDLTETGLAFGSGKVAFSFGLMTSYTEKFGAGEHPIIAGDWDVLPPLKWDADTPDEYRGAVVCGNALIINKFANENEQAAGMLLLDYLRSREAKRYELVVEGNGCFIPSYFDETDIAQKVDWDLANQTADKIGIPHPLPKDELAYADLRKQIVIYGRNEVFPPSYPAVENKMREEFANAILGKVSVDEALQAIQTYADEY